MGYEILRKVAKRKVFQNGDGSEYERLNHLYNRLKHTESAIERDQIPKDSTLPVWMTNAGLQSADSNLSWQELANLLAELSSLASVLEDPLTARERFDAVRDDKPLPMD